MGCNRGGTSDGVLSRTRLASRFALVLVGSLLLTLTPLASPAWARETVEVTVQIDDPSGTPPPSAPAPEDPGDPAEPVLEPDPDGPLPRTGADLLRVLRDALALIAGGLAVVRTTRRNAQREP